jgi:uncharacterized protein YbaP (TraB family)
MTRSIWCLAILYTVGGLPAVAQRLAPADAAQQSAPRTGPAAAVRPASKGFVWTVERDGRPVGWLMGSIHMLTPDAYPLPASMEAAFQASQVLVEETDPGELQTPEAVAEVTRRAFFPLGDSLESHVSATTYKTIVDRATKAGLPLQAVQQMRPWMVAVTLAAVEIQKGGYDPALGLDKHFRDRAVAMGKPVRTLEAAMEQVAMLEALGPALQDALVVETLSGAASEIAQTRALTAAWKAGDGAGIERLLVDDMKDSPEIFKALLLDRNARWVPQIESCLTTARCLVVVGAAHLVGRDGLIDLLRRRGYRVEQH